MTKTILVLECTPSLNWYEIFDGAKLISGEEVKIEQATWSQVRVTSYSNTGCTILLRAAPKPLPNSTQANNRTCQPDLVLFRTLSQGVGHLDHKNLLYAIKHSGIPCINSLESMWGMMQKPWVYGELLQIQKRVGYEAFPLIGQTYYPTHRDMNISI